MSKLTLVVPGRYALEGTINKASVPELVEKGWNVLAEVPVGEAVAVNLSAVRHADSAALAMLLAWMRRSAEKQLQLSFHDFPEELAALARVCGIDALFTLSD